MVVGNVDGAEVPVLVDEEVKDVEGLQHIHQDHRIGDVAELLELGSRKGKVDQGPADDARAAVVEELEVPKLAEAGIELDSHVKVVDPGAGELAVLGVGGEQVGLDVGKGGQEIAIDVGGNQERSPVVSDDAWGEGFEVERAVDEEDVGDGPGLQSIDVVGEQQTSRSSLTIANLAWDKGVQEALEKDPAKVEGEALHGWPWQSVKDVLVVLGEIEQGSIEGAAGSPGGNHHKRAKEDNRSTDENIPQIWSRISAPNRNRLGLGSAALTKRRLLDLDFGLLLGQDFSSKARTRGYFGNQLLY